MGRRSPFLTAAWRDLIMLNYDIDPAVLQPHVPAGCELDLFNGRAYASIVGFMFTETRVLGVPVPFHTSFEEVNLRFYVRRRGPEGWRRAVVFISEIVPKRAIAWLARTLYGENYVSMPMSHEKSGDDPIFLRYGWDVAGRENFVSARICGDPLPLVAGSEEEFIAEHYWGYSRRRDGGTTEYEVAHPPWRVWQAEDAVFDCDVATLYGEEFAPFLKEPASAFVAEGSEVTVYKGRRIEVAVS